MASVRQFLQDTLEDLAQKDLKKFCVSLMDRQREGEHRVKRRALEDQDEIAIAEVLVSTFTGALAGQVAVETLHNIGCNQMAVELKDKLEKLNPPESRPSANTTTLSATELNPPESRPSANTTTLSATASPGEHFVDKHRIVLIQNIRRFPAILNKLLECSMLNQKEYDAIMAKPNPRDQARDLYDGALKSSGTSGKDIFLNVLYEIEPFLLEDLYDAEVGS